MAAKKKGKKTGPVTVKPSSSRPKMTLPAFGLAEEILGSNSEQQTLQGDKSSGIQSASNGDSGFFSEKPADLPSSDNGPTLHLVTFSVDEEEYGVDIGSVQEIIRVSQITAVPNAPEFVKGVINLRGRVIPVLNLRKRLGLAEAKLTKNSRIMVVESGAKVLGMLVDGVAQVIRIPLNAIDAPPTDIEGSKAFVKGIGKIDSRLIMIMELDKVLTKETRQPVG